MWEVVADNSNDGMTLDMPPVAAQTEEFDLFVLTGDAPDIGFGGYIASANPDGVSNRHHYIFTWEDGTNPFVNDVVGGINIGIRQSEIAAAGFTVDYTKPILFQSSTPLGGTATLRVNNGFSKNGSVGAIDTSANIWTIFCRPPIAGNPSAGPIRLIAGFRKILSAATLTAFWNWLLLNRMAPLPVNTVAPSFSGTLGVSFELTGDDGTWTGATSFSRRWLRNGVPIFGATNQTYVPVEADNGQTLTYRVIGINSTGAATALSASQVIPLALAPTQIPDCELWLTARDADSFTYYSGDLASQWEDQTDNDNHAVSDASATALRRRISPTDGQPEVFADVNGRYMRIPTLRVFTPRTEECDVFVMLGANSDLNGGALIGLTNTATGTNRHMYAYTWNDGTNPLVNVNLGGQVHGRSLAQVQAAYPAYALTSPQLWEMAVGIGNNNSALRIDNIYEQTGLACAGNDMTDSSWNIFCRNPIAGFPWQGSARDYAVFSRVITTTERAALKRYFQLHAGLP